ncbi:MAG: hypothetical protein WD535_02155 [Thermaerobacterales bacterium]
MQQTRSSVWQPGLLRPMLAKGGAQIFDDDQWQFEIKWDGYRCLAFISKQLFLQSRNGVNLTPKYPELHALAGCLPKAAVLDGELVAMGSKGPEFNRLRGSAGLDADDETTTLQLIAFDVLHAGGCDCIHQPLHERRELLHRLMSDIESPAASRLAVSPAIRGKGRTLFERAREWGYEGIMAKQLQSTYRPGQRSDAWLKFPIRHEADFLIGGIRSGRRHGFGSLLLGAVAKGPGGHSGRSSESGFLHYVGKVGSGLNRPEISDILTAVTPRADSPFDPHPALALNGDTVFVHPELVCRIHYLGWTGDGLLRQGSFQRRLLDGGACPLPADHPLSTVEKGGSGG